MSFSGSSGAWIGSSGSGGKKWYDRNAPRDTTVENLPTEEPLARWLTVAAMLVLRAVRLAGPSLVAVTFYMCVALASAWWVSRSRFWPSALAVALWLEVAPHYVGVWVSAPTLAVIVGNAVWHDLLDDRRRAATRRALADTAAQLDRWATMVHEWCAACLRAASDPVSTAAAAIADALCVRLAPVATWLARAVDACNRRFVRACLPRLDRLVQRSEQPWARLCRACAGFEERCAALLERAIQLLVAVGDAVWNFSAIASARRLIITMIRGGSTLVWHRLGGRRLAAYVATRIGRAAVWTCVKSFELYLRALRVQRCGVTVAGFSLGVSRTLVVTSERGHVVNDVVSESDPERGGAPATVRAISLNAVWRDATVRGPPPPPPSILLRNDHPDLACHCHLFVDDRRHTKVLRIPPLSCVPVPLDAGGFVRADGAAHDESRFAVDVGSRIVLRARFVLVRYAAPTPRDDLVEESPTPTLAVPSADASSDSPANTDAADPSGTISAEDDAAAAYARPISPPSPPPPPPPPHSSSRSQSRHPLEHVPEWYASLVDLERTSVTATTTTTAAADSKITTPTAVPDSVAAVPAAADPVPPTDVPVLMDEIPASSVYIRFCLGPTAAPPSHRVSAPTVST